MVAVELQEAQCSSAPRGRCRRVLLPSAGVREESGLGANLIHFGRAKGVWGSHF